MLRTYSPAGLLAPKEPRRAFPYWARLVNRVNLRERGGYALQGSWVDADEIFAPGPGDYLVISRTIGSRKNPIRDTVLYAFGPDGPRVVSREERNAVIQAAFDAQRVSKEQIVQGENSQLYHFALFIHLKKEAADANA